MALAKKLTRRDFLSQTGCAACGCWVHVCRYRPLENEIGRMKEGNQELIWLPLGLVITFPFWHLRAFPGLVPFHTFP
jgi:hypothetical protein